MKTKRRARVEKVRAAPKGQLKKVRSKADKAADHTMRGQAYKVAGQLEPYADTARKVVTERASDAWEWAEPRLEYATDTVQNDIAPKVSSALTTAAERSAPAREEALERGTAAVAALKGGAAAQPKQKRRWPLALLFFFVGGALGVAGGMFGQRFFPAQTVSAGSGPDGDRAATGTGSAARRETEDTAPRNAQPPQG